jgi:FtsP/CotA-like multicopper oxidase with cupredoxin domain
MKVPVSRFLPMALLGFLTIASAPLSKAQSNATAANPCPRFAAGSTVSEPPALYSSAGFLVVNLSYNTIKEGGQQLYCFTTANGQESPTLHVQPGDFLTINLKNNLPKPVSAGMTLSNSTVCGDTTVDASSVNMHFHGVNAPPTCAGDEVIYTLIDSGHTFTYNFQIPIDEPPGLYWYHPHIHGLAEAAVLGGATGAIVVDGIENVQTAVSGLPERILVVRDQVTLPGDPPPGGGVPSWDISVNYVPILWPNFKPAAISMKPGEKEFWRVVNSSADTIADFQLLYDGVPQTIQIVGLDGVPTGSQDATAMGALVPVTDIRVPPGGRVEFIMTGPAMTVKLARFMTLIINTGPDGDNDPGRPLILITPNPAAPTPALTVPITTAALGPQRFAGLASATPNTSRQLYFSENNPLSQFFITVQGATPTLFSVANPPAIITKQGSVEDWVIQNQTLENHEFHIHQIHFLLMSKNGVPVSAANQQMLDTIDIPHWDGVGPYPSVTIRLDFRGPDIGDFVYHCHILEHEDGGMMAIIRVIP